MKIWGKTGNKNNSIQDENHRTGMMRWGMAFGILIFVIAVMVAYFTFVSRKEAYKSIESALILQSDIYARDMAHRLKLACSAAGSVAGIMSAEERYSNDDVAWYAKNLKETQDTVYMVVITDNSGVGFTDEGLRVDISDMDYFVVSRNPGYFITKDDGIVHNRAYVMTIPYYQDDISEGTIYMFVSAETMAELVPTDGYDLRASFALCDIKGNILARAGKETAFLENDQFIDTLQSADFEDDELSSSRILTRFGNMSKFAFGASYKGEQKTFVSVPLGISDWQYVTVLGSDYVSRMVEQEWKTARDMTIRLGVVTIIFILLIIIISVINKLRYNERNKELANKADTDQLTGLNNKIATERKIQEYIEQNPNKQCLFFLFDIDNFKKINDTLGHAFGDEVLRSLGSQLSNEFRVTDIIGRTGGDEFILFLKDIKTDEILEKEARRLVNFFHNFQAGEYVKYSATSSIGATVYPRDAKDYNGLYKAADSALYEAKRQGKNRMVFYNDSLETITPGMKKVTPIDSDMN